MLRKLVSAFSGLALILLLALTIGLGQSTLGSISGTVTDPSGALIPGAQVQVTNAGTGAVRTVVTGPAGVFNVPALPFGTYQVRASAKGFTAFERGGLHLSANQIMNLPVRLQVGTSSTIVQIHAASPVIATETSDISGSMNHQTLESLPSVGRHNGATGGIYDYAALTTGTGVVYKDSNPNIGGARTSSGTLPTMDGIAVMAYPEGGGPVQPSFEGIQEIKTDTAVAPAEFPTAGNFQVISKAGTNQYHGSVFYDYNGNALNARNFFSPTTPFNVYNDFGGSIGGPVVKNKLFFFADYEGSRNEALGTWVESVPIAAWKNGDFSSISTPLVNPFNGQLFPGNVIPNSLISPVSQKIQNYIWPSPNAGTPGVVTNNYDGSIPTINGFDNYDDVDFRVDYNASPRDSLFVHGSYRRLPADNYGLYPLYGNQLRWGKSAVLGWTHIFSPTVLSEFRFGMTYQRNYYYSTTPGNTLLDQFGITGVPTAGWGADPYFNISGVTPWDGDSSALEYEDNPEATFEWFDNVSWTHGRHFMKFGFDAIRDRLGGTNVNSSVYGEYDFPGTYTGSGYSDFLLGIPRTTELAIPTPSRNLRGTTMGMYAQDQFKVNSSLTLNYGLRWEIEEPYTDKHGLLYSFDPATGDLVIPDSAIKEVNPFYPKNIPIESAFQAGYPVASLVNTNMNALEPRIGFAYKLLGSDKTVVRGGYGIYSNLIYASLARQQMSGGPYSGSVTYVNSITNGIPLFSFPQPFLASGKTSTQNVTGVNPNLKTPYTQEWELSVERQVGQWGLRVSYLGSRTDQLAYVRNLNEPPPSTTSFKTSEYFYPLYHNISYADSGGNELYNALELSVVKKYGRNLTLSSGLTWAKDLTDTQDAVGGSAWGGQTIQNQFCRACEEANNAETLPRVFYVYGLYGLPIGQGQRFLGSLHGPLQKILGGWQATWTAMLESGPYFTPSFSGFDPSNTNTIGGRPDVVPGVSLIPSGGQTITGWFNPAAFKVPGCPDSTPRCKLPANVGRFGNAGLNTLEGPPFRNLNFGLQKKFKIREGTTLQFILTMENALNHPNFRLPSANISSPGTVGVISGTANTELGVPSPREIDFGMRLDF